LLPTTTKVVVAFCKNKNPKTQKVSRLCLYADEHGLKKLKCSCVQMLWLAHLMIALSGDVEENPGPFTQISNDKNAPCANQVNSVSLLESR